MADSTTPAIPTTLAQLAEEIRAKLIDFPTFEPTPVEPSPVERPVTDSPMALIGAHNRAPWPTRGANPSNHELWCCAHYARCEVWHTMTDVRRDLATLAATRTTWLAIQAADVPFQG